jgi:hypothetical protein
VTSEVGSPASLSQSWDPVPASPPRDGVPHRLFARQGEVYPATYQLVKSKRLRAQFLQLMAIGVVYDGGRATGVGEAGSRDSGHCVDAPLPMIPPASSRSPEDMCICL